MKFSTMLWLKRIWDTYNKFQGRKKSVSLLLIYLRIISNQNNRAMVITSTYKDNNDDMQNKLEASEYESNTYTIVKWRVQFHLS